MSIKRVSVFSFIMIFLFVIFALFVNFSLISRVRDFLETNREVESAISDSLSKMNEPMTTLRLLNDSEILVEEDLRDRLFSVAQATIVFETATLIEHMDSLINLLKDMNEYSLNRHSRYLEQLIPMIERLQQYNLQLNTLAYQRTVNDLGTMDFDQKFLVLENEFLLFQQSNRELIRLIGDDISLVVNVMFVLLIFIIFIFGLAIRGFVNTQLPYIKNSVLSLGNHDYRQDFPIAKPVFEEEKVIHRNIQDLFTENTFIELMRGKLQNIFSMEDALELIFSMLREKMSVDRIGIAFVDYTKNRFIAEYGILDEGDILLGPGFEVPIESSTLSQILIEKKTRITDDIPEQLKKRPNSPSLNMLNKEGILSNMIIPILLNQTVYGFLFISSKKRSAFTTEDVRFVEKIMIDIKDLLNRAYFSKVVLAKMTDSFAQLVDKKDNDTGDHIERMVRYSVMLARELKKLPVRPGYEINEKLILEIERQASSHDIGKVGIPDAILKKEGPLTKDEWENMKKHPDIGADIFKNLREGLKIFDHDFYRVAEDITRYHHEKWDGSGYPRGLSGTDIPLVARIVAIADVFDAISSKRVYKDAIDIEKTFELLEKSKGTHLDPWLVDLFLKEKDQVIDIYNRYH
jgi:response regulator RpfG family c-di-GMP phosphodiesterase